MTAAATATGHDMMHGTPLCMLIYCNWAVSAYVACYLQAKETLEQQQPPEVRILKQLLRIQSPQQRQTALFDAFEPGANLSSQEQDLLST